MYREDAENWFAKGGDKDDPEDVSFFEACDLASISAEEMDACIMHMMALPKKEGLAYAKLLSRAIVHDQRIPTPERLKIPSLAKELEKMRNNGHFGRAKATG